VTGDRVAAQVDKCWEALALYLGCLRTGLVFLPLNTGYQKGELAYFFNDAEPRVIVCRPESAQMVAALRPASVVLTLAPGGGSLLEAAAEATDTFETVTSRPDDLAAILYTSGTTGRS
jgi:malonyl-CoA/methylmalonyl-CoA synthetase